MSDETKRYEEAHDALGRFATADNETGWDALRKTSTALRALLDLHKPYWSVPLEIADGPVTITEEGIAAEDWREATEFEQITGGRWWCDACRADAPCPSASLILDAVLGRS